ncbi:DUF7848 domain-containing protein [Streptomyces lunaelactis]|uniref:DUF7848 domain-containing protein n=2 Tax=Streptomyces lunaelactis TaxID=1535768 RepID=UPI00403992B8
MARVMRSAGWTLSIDLSGSGPIFEAECTSCGEASGPADDRAGPEIWCLRHAGRTGHTGFRGITTAFFRAALEGSSAVSESAAGQES